MQPWCRHAFVARHTVLFARRTFQANQASTTTLALVQKRPLLYPHQLQLHLCTICTVKGPAALLACCAVLELSSGIWAALDPAAAFTDVCQLQSSELSELSVRAAADCTSPFQRCCCMVGLGLCTCLLLLRHLDLQQ